MVLTIRNLIAISLLGCSCILTAQISIQYDNLSRLAQTSYNNGTIVQYCYDELGNRTCKTIQVTVPPTVDLTFTNTPTVAPTTVGAGSNTILNGTLNNTGTGATGASVVKYYLSNNSTLGGGDTLLNSTYVSSVAAGGDFSLSNVGLQIPANATSGTYYIIVVADADVTVAESSENNNIAVIQVTVVNCIGLSVSFNVTNTTCGNSNGAVAATTAGGQQPYTYLWGNGSSSASLSSLTAGLYPLTVTDGNGCTVSNTATVNPSQGITASVTTGATSCLSNTGTASVIAAGASTYTYLWSNNATTSVISNLGIGTYTVTVTGNTTCTTTASGTVTYTNSGGNSIPLTIGNDTSICIGATVTLTATNGFASYLWSNGQTSQTVTLSNLPVGQNVITILADACGTVSRDTAIITVVASPTVSISPATATITVGQNITLTASGASIYSWSNGGNTAAITVSPTTTTIYTVTATNATGCTAVSDRLVTVNPMSSAFIKPDEVLLNGNSVVFTYPTTLGTVSNLNPSFISIIGEATGFKTGSLAQQGNVLTFNCSTSINPGELLHIIIKKGMINTLGDSLAAFNKIVYAPAATTSCGLFDTVSAGIKFPSTAYAYSINTADFDKNGVQDVVCQYYTSNGAATNLAVLLRNANGTFQPPLNYTNSQSYSGIIGTPDLNNDSYPDIVVSHNVPSSVAVWLNNGNGTFQTTPTLYTVSSYSNGARILDIDNDGFLDIISYSGISSLAQNRVSVLRNNGNGTFAPQVVYSTNSAFGSQLQPIDLNNDGWIDLAYTSNTAYNSQPTFQLFQNNQNGQVSNILNQPNPTEWYVNGVADFNSDGNEDLLVGRSSANAIWWGDGNANFNTNTSLDSLSGAYTSIGDIDGDGRFDLIVKHQLTTPTAQNPYITHRNLGNGSFSTFTGNGGYAKFGAPKTQDLNGDGALDYFYVGNNDTIYIALNRAKPIVTASATPNSICTGQTAIISATSGYVNYQWSNGSTNASFAVTASGLYTVTVTDAVGCTNTASVTLNFLPSPIASISPSSATICSGQNISLTASGGGTYAWSNSGGSGAQATFSPTLSTTYTVTVTNANNCTATASRLVTVNANPTAAITPATVAICNGQSATLTASGGGTYTWSNSGGSNAQATFSPTTSTTYTVTVTNANNCTATASRLVTVNANPTAAITPATVTICSGQSATLTANGGTSYAWSNSGGSSAQATFNPTTSTTYTVTVTNANNCTATASRLVTVNNNSTATLNQTICQGQSYNFNGQNLTQAGTYYDTLTNANGCDSLITLNLSVGSFISSAINASICQGQTYTFNGANLVQGGVYKDTLTASSGCDSIITLNLTVNNNSTATINQTICQGQSYSFNGQNLTQAGIYYDTLTNTKGCDSLITLNLSVGSFISSAINASICQGQTYTFNGVNLVQAGVYKDTLIATNGCDSITTLNLTVNNNSTATVNQTICQGQSYSFNGQNLTQTGTYYDTLTNANGCDSLITLNLSVGSFVSSTINASICQGQSYAFNGVNLVQAGVYKDTLIATNGCDSIITLNLTVNNSSTATVNQTICQGQSYSFNGQNLTQSGIYYDTLTNAKGCDSLITLNLSVNNSAAITLNQSICQGQSYAFNGVNLVQGGVYKDTLTASNGCDSIITLNLTVNNSSTATVNQTICQGQSYSFNGQNLTQAGTYYDTLTNAKGCDSLITLNLLVNNSAAITLNQSICQGQSYAFNGVNLVQGGVYKDTLTASNGCDSIITLNLTVNNNSTATVNQTICQGQSYSFNGQNLTQSGIYYDTLTNAKGCDSLITLNLSVGSFISSTINASICQGQSYAFNGVHLVQGGVYKDTLTASNGCDSIITLNLTVNQLPQPTVLQNGNMLSTQQFSSYQWLLNNIMINGATNISHTVTASGSYSVVVTDVNGCSDTSNVLNITSTRVTEIENWTVMLYPNPNTGRFILQHNYNGELDVAVTDVTGRVVAEWKQSQSEQQIDLDILAAGIYHLRIFDKTGILQVLRWVKE